MRTIERTHTFKRDYRREKQGVRARRLDAVLAATIQRLAMDEPLPPRMVDHALGGQLRGFRDCHVFPDLVLIYENPDAETLRLVRLGSHSQLGL